MSNWALELQALNIVRVWIRGETNILADAPSRAPVDTKIARSLPVPNMEVKELLKMMYTEPEAFEHLVQERARQMGLKPDGFDQPTAVPPGRGTPIPAGHSAVADVPPRGVQPLGEQEDGDGAHEARRSACATARRPSKQPSSRLRRHLPPLEATRAAREGK